MSAKKTGNIFQLLPKVAADIGVVGKDSKNAGQHYRYRGIEAVMDACHAALVKHGVTLIPNVINIEREERKTNKGGNLIYTVLTVRYYLVAPDGSSIDATVIGEGMDSSDKSANKAMSAAFKYMAGQVFSIPFDAVDSEVESLEVGPKQKRRAGGSLAEKPKKPANGSGDAIEAARGVAMEALKRKLITSREDCFARASEFAGRIITDWPQATAEELAAIRAGFERMLTQ